MRLLKIIGFIFISGLSVGLAEMDASKYSAIPQRNAFNLREPEPPKPPEQPPPPVTVKLTGITTLLDTKRVFLIVQEQGKQPESKIMREGEKDGPVEVVQIDESTGSVKIINSGKEVTLNFEKDGVKPPTAPAQSPMPATTGQPPMPGATTFIPLPGAIPTTPSPTHFTVSNTPVPGMNISISGRTFSPNTPPTPQTYQPQNLPSAQPRTPSPIKQPGSMY